ncbi:Odorant receptor 49b [Frankliniella fusca]|uniref:Odorant receptor n=1 Tax=Frankliniella fusca TaxID=407009 RepID=A0AAE1HU46_9NEOP|nr:Odorant receptor 49b [Frankliniella fusca]
MSGRGPEDPARARTQRPMFARSMWLLRAGGMWPPPASAPDWRRDAFEARSLLTGAFMLLNALGELGGIFTLPRGCMERVCQNICSTLWRLLGFMMWLMFRHHVVSIQALMAEVERIAGIDHGVHGVLHARVEELQQGARTRINNIILGFISWFTYSSTAVVTQPFVNYLVIGSMPRPVLPSNFWLLVGPDTPFREAVMMLSQSLAQYVSTVIVIGYISFLGGIAVFLSHQALILGAMLEAMPFATAGRNPAGTVAVTARVRHCIAFHQDILRAAEDLNRVLRLMLLFLFMICLAFIATMVYQVSVVPPTNSLFMATVMILICSNSLVGVFCYCSDQLREATGGVVHRVMASDWTSAPVPVQRLLEFVVFRATKPSALWCWRALTISRVTWLQVLNKSYSVFAVLRS